MRLEAERIATSPVPPRPLWQQVTMAESMGYIFITLPMKKPATVIETTTDMQTSTYPTEKTFTTLSSGT